MATSQQHEIKELSTAEENTSMQERTPLMGNKRHSNSVRIQSKICCRRQRCCLTSKAVILILLWNFILVVGFESFLDPNFFGYMVGELDKSSTILLSGSTYAVLAFLFLFYPLAGCLADIRWGRYKTIINSLCFILWGMLFILVLGGLSLIPSVIPMFLSNSGDNSTDDAEPTLLNQNVIVTSLIVLILYIMVGFGGILFLSGLIAFSANSIQFGTDQLHDAPTEDIILYIHWYVWTCYAGLLPMKLGFNIIGDEFIVYSPCLILLPLPILGATLCIQRYKRHWFLMDSGSKNPYKLVYKALKFAKAHTSPINRSAFTYSENELPSRLDLGKEKYGGPFTTEQVEDVKAFLGILCVLLTLGPIMMIDFSVGGILVRFAGHLDGQMFESITNVLPFNNSIKTNIDSVTSLLIVVLIPIYLFLLRHLLYKYIPGVLKRLGLGMIFIFLSILCTSVMDTYGHVHGHANVTECFLANDPDYDSIINHVTTLNINSHSLIIQYSLNAMGYMLLYIAVYEFICSQSPHAMKGLVIGTFFAIKGVFQLLGVLLTYLPFAVGWNTALIFPSCGFVYYLINAIIAIIGIVAYTCVARQYQYRQRDEPDNIYRYAEEYYANAQDEPNYDYDDYDNLNVHTIN